MFFCIVRAFPIDCIKFKLKFSLRPYFFYFSLPLFKTLPSNSLFLTLFYLNIHFLLFSLIFHNSQNTFISYFPPTLSLFVAVVFPLPLFFFPFFPTTHVPLLFSFFFLSFFSPPPTYPLPFFLTSPPPDIFPLPLFTSPHSSSPSPIYFTTATA